MLRSLLAVLALATILVACDGRDIVRSDTGSIEIGPVRTSAGLTVDLAVARRSHDRLLRAVALALNDSQLRGKLYKMLLESPVKENKLDFNDLVTADGDFRTALATAAGRRENWLVANLDSVVNLEIYLPVPGHLEQWSGSADYVVAGLISEELDHARGFDSDGTPYPLDAETPPELPVIAVVPREGSPRPTGDDVGADRVPTTPLIQPLNYGSSAGFYMTYSSIDNLSSYEHWMKGAPEVEVHTLFEDPNDSTWWASCAGANNDGAFPEYYFNQDSDAWSGSVRLNNDEEGHYAAQHRPIMLMLEDDTSPCWGSTFANGHPGIFFDGTLPTAVSITAIFFTASCWLGGNPPEVCVLLTLATAAIYVHETTDNDDLIGWIEVGSQGCWQTESGVEESLVIHPTAGGVGIIKVDLEVVARDRLCLTGEVAGPTLISGTGYNEWDVSPNGGTGSHSVEWLRRVYHHQTCTYETSWQQVGTGTTYDETIFTYPDYDFQLRARITSGPDTTFSTQSVYFDDPQTFCPQ